MTVTDEKTGPAGGRGVVEKLRASGGLGELFELIDSGQVELTGSDGLLPALLKEALERGLAAELTDHSGYEKGEPTPVARGNARNGTTTKTIDSEAGSFETRGPPRPRRHVHAPPGQEGSAAHGRVGRDDHQPVRRRN